MNSQSKLFYMGILQNVVLGGWNVKMRNCRVINLEIWFMKNSASSMPGSCLNHEQTGMIISWCSTKTFPLGQLIRTRKSKWRWELRQITRKTVYLGPRHNTPIYDDSYT